MKALIDKIQELIDLHGDSWLAMFTTLIIVRIAMAAFKFPAITPSEAAAYASCITAFSYSNVNKH